MSQVFNFKTAKENGFVSDGCTCSPDFDFAYCCEMHDYLYWRGGINGSRAKADEMLFLCILRNGKRKEQPVRYRILANIYWLFVRLFGWYSFSKRKTIIESMKK